MSDDLYMLALRLPFDAATAVAELLESLDEPLALAVSQVEVDQGAAWRVEAIYDQAPDRALIQTLLAPVIEGLGLSGLEPIIDKVPEKDWVVVSLQVLAPVRAGRFVVHGRHDLDHVVRGPYSLEIEASRAFGTGHHETTQGCLTAIDRLAHVIRPKRIFDLGCGTAVLAMASARVWQTRALASDLDPQAITIAKETVKANRLGHVVQLATAPGFAHPKIRRHAPFDLVLANVLVNPLAALAPDMRRYLRLGGVVVLSGILNRQAENLVNRYRSFGFVQVFSLQLGDWSTLVLRRRT
jgi:ribosomal protein L11 methyltransferase